MPQTIEKPLEITVLDDREVCHVGDVEAHLGDPSLCGEPLDCDHVARNPEVCPGCGRLLCDECMRIGDELARPD